MAKLINSPRARREWMIAQAYNDGTIHLYDSKNKLICRMEFSPCLKVEADKQLRRLKIKRSTAWKDTDWGSEATVNFCR